jgi:beta-lactamase class A
LKSICYNIGALLKDSLREVVMRRRSRKRIYRNRIFSLLMFILIGVGAYGGYNYVDQNRSKAAVENKVEEAKNDENINKTDDQKSEDQKTPEEEEVKPAEEEENPIEEQKPVEEQKPAEQVKPPAQNNSTQKPPTTPSVDVEKIINSQAPLEQKIKQYIGTNVAKVGLAYYDIETGKGFSINGDKYYTAASTVKVQMNMVLFDMVKEGKIKIDSSILYNPNTDYEGGTGILQGKDKSKPIPLLTLSDYSIIYSDNIATRMIMRTINRTEMKRRFGVMVGHSVPVDKNVVTPNEGMTFLKRLYENKGDNQYYTRLIGIMKETVFHDRLDKYVPKSIVAHKIGNYGTFINDVGIVYAKKPYIIAVYTEGLTNANEVIANINKIIYAEHK